MEPTGLTAAVLASLVKNGDLGAREIAGAFLRAIREKNKMFNGYITVCEKEALAEAENLDRKRAAGEPLGPLAGVPVAVKDNICTKGVLTTCGSKMLHNHVPLFDATVVERLRRAGAVILGKTNMDEFAMGSTTETSFIGPAKNPLDPARIPGGSSGGSAAAVAAGMACCALGSDTGGSIRMPAACCGVTGIKPTYGRVSRYGLVAFASSLDQIGPITRDVRDAALLLSVICGFDSMDSTSSEKAVPDFTAGLEQGVKGLRVGLPREYLAEGLDPDIRRAVLTAARKLSEQGAPTVEVSLPGVEYAVAAYYIIATAEASSNLARYDGVKYGFRKTPSPTLKEMYETTRSEGFGNEVKRRIMLGTYVLSAGYYDAYYRKAQQARSLISRDFDRAFESCDVILSPTMPTPPYRLGEKSSDPLAMYLGDIYTTSVNLAGLPGLTLPFGKAGGFPAGMQLIGRAYDEAVVLRVAKTLEDLNSPS